MSLSALAGAAAGFAAAAPFGFFPLSLGASFFSTFFSSFFSSFSAPLTSSCFGAA